MTAALIGAGVVLAVLLLGLIAYLIGGLLALHHRLEAVLEHSARHDCHLAHLEGRVTQLEKGRRP